MNTGVAVVAVGRWRARCVAFGDELGVGASSGSIRPVAVAISVFGYDDEPVGIAVVTISGTVL
jgi:hypothetical protein